MALKRREELTITDNYVFGEIMEKPEFCVPLIEAILNVPIDHVEVHHSEHNVIPRFTGRGARLDVYLRDHEGVAYDLEMQNCSQKGFERRLGYYRSVLDVDAQERGTDYDDMRDVVVIFFTRFDPFGERRARYDCETIVRQTGVRLRDGARIVVLSSKGDVKAENQQLDAFLRYMEDATIGDEYTRKVDAEVRRLRQDDDWYGVYMRYQLHVDEEVARERKRAIKEGRAEGRAEGIELRQEQDRLLAFALQEAGRADELVRAMTDSTYHAALLTEFGIA